ncbi:hypothetical protein C7444_111112 [Sphaerotilus hippei]|uniref:UPF0434 protein C7444_111112 n=1 Tax=Sphaerotilus hippei TaxID=744406 RepID=A0A318GZF0_9BURK|nr:Trm112 family protein [Sphaerotilus hippei]PXW95028.1 hypothetical protein C7444_111112 [Sphaerotilus hippei]
MDTRLMQLLVCPVCKGPLTRDTLRDELCCAADHLAFPIRDGIPIMLEHEARTFDPNPEPTLPALLSDDGDRSRP